jgi:pilus assembly protein CpaB
MAKKPGAGGIILVAVILGLVTAYLIWSYLRKLDEQSRKNWVSIVVAKVDIKPRTPITPDMIELRDTPPDMVAPDAIKDRKKAENHMSINRIKAKEQLRDADFVAGGDTASLAFEVPAGMRAISIGAGEVQSVGTAIKPNDKVDILATYVDPVNRQETTKTILQMVTVLAVNKGQTDANGKEGASSSMTLLVTPEQAELLTAVDRQGTLRIALRPPSEEKKIESPGVTIRDIRGGMTEAPAPSATGSATPVIISMPRQQSEVISVYRGVQREEVSPR